MKTKQNKLGNIKGFIVGSVFTMSAVILVGHVLASVSVGGVPEKVTGASVSLTEFNSIVGTIRGIFNDGGKIGLGVTNPTETLDVAGSIQVNNNTIKGVATPVAGTDAVNKDFVVEALNDSGMPMMISKKSLNAMYQGQAAQYCNGLSEGGFDDWRMPTFDELSYAVSTLKDTNGSVPNGSNYLWTRTRADYSVIGGAIGGLIYSNWLVLHPSNGNWYWYTESNDNSIRCVR